MHTFNESGGAGVPAFLAKLWRLVDDPDTNNLICWSKDGRSFIIQNQAQFARELLPLNYKHNNMASFIRQLNMYGFHKITSIENGGLKFDRDEMEFSHPCFKRNSPYLLEHIKRKISNTKQHVEEKAPAIKPEAVTKVLADVKAMRGRQDNLDTRFSEMKQENEALWREIAALRQKHTKQQQIVNKLIQFLITIVQPSMRPNMKRHMQLMINDTPENARLRTSSDSESDCGPVIHELGEELLAESDELMNPDSPYNYFTGGSEGDMGTPVKEERPQSSISQYECSNHSMEDASNMRAGTPNSRNGATISIGSPVSPGIIQSMNADGTGVVYHVTEVPDAPVAQEISNAVLFEPDTGAVTFNEENVLTTPMVRQQMARSILKQKNKQRRQQRLDDDKKADDAAVASAAAEASNGGKVQQRAPSKRVAAKKSVKDAGAEAHQGGAQEKPLDPMQFLTVYHDDNEFSNDANLLSPNTAGFIETGNTNSNASGNGVYTTVAGNNGQTATLNQTAETRPDAFETNQYMVNDMPTLFDDASLISNDSNLGDNFKLQQQQQQLQQQQQQQQEQEQFGQSTTSNGKFSSYLVTPTNVDTSPSTSAAAKRSAQAKKSLNQTAAASPTPTAGSDNNMAVTKYKNEDILRLSTATDVSDHLENVQDELDSLKDLLKGDGYSLDATTLMGINDLKNHGAPEVSAPAGFSFAQGFGLDGEYLAKLFNDSDLLGPYGLSFGADMPQGDKKGSELMAYQPSFDLSDIINGIDDKSNDAESSLSGLGGMPSAIKDASQKTGSPAMVRNSSMLNTP